MRDRQHQESFAASPSNNDPSVRPLTGPFDGELERDKPGREREEEWQQRLCSLQEWICHLLIRNQQLRMALDSEIGRRSRETNQEES
jgi:hypothetical protein